LCSCSGVSQLRTKTRRHGQDQGRTTLFSSVRASGAPGFARHAAAETYRLLSGSFRRSRKSPIAVEKTLAK
jgi:hypothetical protein